MNRYLQIYFWETYIFNLAGLHYDFFFLWFRTNCGVCKNSKRHNLLATTDWTNNNVHCYVGSCSAFQVISHFSWNPRFYLVNKTLPFDKMLLFFRWGGGSPSHIPQSGGPLLVGCPPSACSKWGCAKPSWQGINLAWKTELRCTPVTAASCCNCFAMQRSLLDASLVFVRS
jgi:hypothetical protein